MGGVGHLRTVSVSDAAPDFTASLTDTDNNIESFTLSEGLGDAPIVLAFFPAALTGTCTTKMCTFCDQMASFGDVGVTVYGISIDAPFTLTGFAKRDGLSFDLISDTDHEPVNTYDAAVDSADPGVNHVAKCVVFVVGDDGRITYAWVSDGPDVEPDYEAIEAAAGKLEAPGGAMQSCGTA